MTTDFIDGHRSRGRFLKGCAFNLAELPMPNLGQAAEDVIFGGDNGEFDWTVFDRIEGLDFVAAVVPHAWRPWL